MKPAKRLLILMMALPVFLNVRYAYAQGQSGIQLEDVGATVRFGEQITFVATVRASIPIRETSIVILGETEGSTHVEPLNLQADGRTEFQYDTRQNILSPFSQVSWNYRFTLPDGSSTDSEVFSTRYEDNRFNWQTLEAESLRVHWYNGDSLFGQAALDSALSGLDSVERLISAELDRPIDFYIYADLNDLRETLIPGSQEWIAGHADPRLGVVMVTIEPGPGQEITMQQRIPHELMHVMLYRSAGSGDHKIPAWFSEGMAGLSEMVPNVDYGRALEQAAARNDMIPISNLCGSFPADTSPALLAYAESQSFTAYLHETYGSPGLLKLANTYAGGMDCKQGPELVFGVPLSKLERDWRASITEQNAVFPALQNIAPYLVLLFLILIIPVIGIASTIRRTGSAHEPRTHIRK